MKSVEIISWPIQKCKPAAKSFDSIFPFRETAIISSNFQKPYLGYKNGEFVEIIIDCDRFLHGYEDLPVYLLTENQSAIEVLEIVLDYFLFDNELNPLIISKILQYLDEKNIGEIDQKKFISQKLKTSPKPKVIEKYKKYSRINENLTDFMIAKKAPLKVWDYVTEFSSEEQLFLQKLVNETKSSLGNFLEIVENLSEAQKITSKSYAEIIGELDLIVILESESDTKLNEIKEKILHFRYPALANHRDELNDLFAQITKPNNLNLQYDQSFEKKEVRGLFTLTNESDFNSLQKFFSSQNKDKLLDILKKM